MKTRRVIFILSFTLALVLLSIPALAGLQAASTADSYDLTWFTLDGGGGSVVSADGVYSLSSTGGQPDAGLLSGGYTLTGGFWYGATLNYFVSLPAVRK